MSTTVLIYASGASAIFAVVLATARDVPILHLLMPPEVECGDAMPAAISFGAIVLTLVGWGPSNETVAAWCQTAAWIGGLSYFWWSAVWHFRERR